MIWLMGLVGQFECIAFGAFGQPVISDETAKADTQVIADYGSFETLR